jgi:hypothetical protein
MENENLIALGDYCMHYSIEISFVHSLNGAGLVEIVTVQNTDYLHREDLAYLEKMVRLHQELDINLEGIEAIAHLLNRLDVLQEELNTLRNRLRLYED